MSGPLAKKKVFSRPDVIVALAPKLFGQEPKLLGQVASRVLQDPAVIPLAGVAGAKEQVYSTASVLATEHAIAACLEAQIERRHAPRAKAAELLRAVAETETVLGRALSSSQREAVLACANSGRGAEILVGVAGAGKTTALKVLADAFEHSECQVIGTATSGQAAKHLGEEAGLSFSRTLASISWRLDHGKLELTKRHVIFLDEASMTDDVSLLKILGAAEGAGAKLILVGDHLQLGAVGPGGAFEALVHRHRDAVQVLDENVRQRDPAERKALSALRSGEVAEAVSWYLGRGRVRSSETRGEALDRATDAWASDYLAGRDCVLLAWRRANVEELNLRARTRIEEAGRLAGPELSAPGGRRYRKGDEVVLLAPLNHPGLVTSERATVVSVDARHASLTLTTKDGRTLSLEGDQISAERLDYAYAMTVHRMQGATTEVSHLFSDGGGRELAYVAMSRAREAAFVYCVADDEGQAREDLRREWSASRRARWASELGLPEDKAPAPAREEPVLSDGQRCAIRLAHLQAQRAAVIGAIPADRSEELASVEKEIATTRRDLMDLRDGEGRFEPTPVGEAAQEVRIAELDISIAKRQIESGRGADEYWSKLAEDRRVDLAQAKERFAELFEAPRRAIEAQLSKLQEKREELETWAREREEWVDEHPEAMSRVSRIDDEMFARRKELDTLRRELNGQPPRTAEDNVIEWIHRPSLRPNDERSHDPHDPHDHHHSPTRHLAHNIGFGR